MDTKTVAANALKLAITPDRPAERSLRKELTDLGIRSAAVDFGGEYISSISKAVEHAVVSAKREGVIGDTHSEEGAVAGAAHEALSQIMQKALGLNVGGKIAIVRSGEHVGVAVFFGIGLLHLNEIAVGLGHRVV